MAKIKWTRRTLIVISLLILLFSGFVSLPESKYYDKGLKSLVKAQNAQVIEVGKGMKLDKDSIYIKRIINTQDKTYIRYAFIMHEQGWSFFSRNSLKVFDDKEKEYHITDGSGTGKLWGEDGLIDLDKIDKNSKYITIKLDWYDRKNELKISLEKEGEINEGK